MSKETYKYKKETKTCKKETYPYEKKPTKQTYMYGKETHKKDQDLWYSIRGHEIKSFIGLFSYL